MARWRCPELVGRRRERDQLKAAWAQAAAGRPGVVVIRGEPGLGKSRLTDALAAHAAAESSGVVTLIGASAPLVGELVPLAPVRQAVQTLDAAEPLRQLLPAVEQQTGKRPPVEQGQLFERIRHGLWTLAEGRPVLLVIEDVHWADPSTVALLAYLDRALRVRPAGAPLPVLMALTTRPDPPDQTAALLAELRRGIADVIELAPMTPAETAAMVAAISAHQVVSAAAGVISARADGNPFLVEELACTDGDRIPDAARDLLVGRLGQVDGDAAEVVRVVAVSGRPLDHQVLAEVTQLPAPRLLHAVRDAVDAGILVAVGDSYRFRHALLGELAREQLLPAERRLIHESLAQALETAGTTAARELAYHLESAGQFDPAARWLYRAAQQADHVPAPVEAADCYDALLALLDRLGATGDLGVPLPELLMRAADANRLAGRAERQLELLAAAWSAADTDDPHTRARILRARSEAFIEVGRAPEGLAPAMEAVRLLEPFGASAQLVDALAAAATAAGRVDRLEDASEFAQRAVLVVENLDDPGARAIALSARGFARFMTDDFAGALTDFEQTRHFAELAGDMEATIRAETRIVGALSYLGRNDDAVALARKCVANAERVGFGNTSMIAMTWNNLGVMLLSHGRWAEAAEVADRLRTGFDPKNPWCAYTPIRLDLLRGDLDTARRGLDVVRDAALGSDAHFQLDLLELDAEVAVLDGDHDGLWAMLPDAVRRFAGTRVEGFTQNLFTLGAGAAADAAVAARARGDDDALATALEHIDKLIELGRTLPMSVVADPMVNTDPDVIAARAQWDAELARLRGDDDAARWEAAARLWQEANSPGPAGYCLWRGADSLARTGGPDAVGRRARLVALLRDAYRVVSGTGDVLLLAKVSALATAARVPVDAPEAADGPAPRTERPHGLTEREVDVLGLLAEGLTNAEIGRRLYISPNTAGVHVSRIFSKLAVTNRTAAAQAARDLGLLSK